MAVLNFEVVSCSSEAEGSEADLVIPGSGGKWQCQNPGSHEYIIIQLSAPAVIAKLVIQNNNSAILSVEACKEKGAGEKSKWHVLLGTSSLMKPSDSREIVNGTNVSTFTNFKDEAKDQPWMCLKFNVFQPFNKAVCCGLTSIEVYDKDSRSSSVATKNVRSSSRMQIASLINASDSELLANASPPHARGIRSLISSGKSLSTVPKIAVNGDARDNSDSENDIQDADNERFLASGSNDHVPVRKTLLGKPSGARAVNGNILKSNDGKLSPSSSRASQRSGRNSRTKAVEETDEDSLPNVVTAHRTRSSSRQSSVASVNSDKDSSQLRSSRSIRGNRKPPQSKDVPDESDEISVLTTHSGSKRDDADDETEHLSTNQTKKRREASPKRVASRQVSKSPEPSETKTRSSQSLAGNNVDISRARRNDVAGPSRGLRGAPRVSPLRDDDVDSSRRKGEATSSRHGLRNEKPFHKIMDDVVFSLSGFVNPERSQLRSDAVQMGARYKPDWDDSCNYLICAFPDTPKFAEASACNANIVKKDWIFECCRQRKLLPWRQYRLYGYENVVDDDKVNDAVIADSAAEVAEDKAATKRRGRGGAAASGARRRGGASSSNNNNNDFEDDSEAEMNTDDVLALLTADDEDEDEDWVPDKNEVAAVAAEEEEDAENEPDPRDVIKEEAEADAEIAPEEDVDDDTDEDDDE